MDEKQTTELICGAALAFGVVGLVAPRRLVKVLGLEPDDSLVAANRLIASRNLVLGLIPRFIDVTDSYPAVLQLAAAMNGIDCLASVVAGVRDQTPKRGAFTLAALTGALAVVAAKPLLAD